MSEHITATEKETYVHEVSAEDAQSDIQRNFPDFKITNIVPAGQGFTNIAFLVNNEYIFRFAKRAHASLQIEREAKLLPLLETYVHLPIPHIEFFGKRQKNDFAFMGYKKIPGITLEKEIFDTFDTETQEKFTKEIAEFIRDTHTFPTEKALGIGVELIDYKKKYKKEYEATEKLIYPIVDDTTRAYLKNLFENYLGDEHNFSYVPTFNHAEVSPYHVIVDTGSKELRGVIDFGDMHIGDPDWDFNYFYSRYGKDYVSRLLKYYVHPDPERLLRKLDFFAKYGELQMVFVGIKESEEILKEALIKLAERVTMHRKF